MPNSLPNLPRQILLVLLYNSAIALFLTAAGSYGWWINFIYAQAIGLSIALSASVVCLLRRSSTPSLGDALISLPFGVLLGIGLGTWGNGLSLTQLLQEHPQAVLLSLSSALFFGLIGNYFFVSQSRMSDALAEVRAEKLLRIEQEALAAKAELRLLQARIEPHFLFNTLSVVVELIDSQPASARQMLLNLVTLLRSAMANTRRESITLGEELDLVRAYLDIMSIRMNSRLSYTIDVDKSLHTLLLPPLLLQPLVENCLRHGLEPKAEGGWVSISCQLTDGLLHCEIADNGRGLSGNAAGTGLGSIHERLHNRYGRQAGLSLTENQGGGVIARLHLPVTEERK